MKNFIIDALVGGRENIEFELKKCAKKAAKRATHAAVSTAVGLELVDQDQTVDIFGLPIPVSLITGLLTQGLAMLLNWHRNRPR